MSTPREPFEPATDEAPFTARAKVTLARVAHVTTIDLSHRYLLLNLHLYLRRSGFDVTAVSAPGPHVAAVESVGVPHRAVAMSRRFQPGLDVAALAALVRLFRRERFDIVHTHTPKAGLLGQYAARIAGVPIRVHTIHGLYLPGGASPRARRAFLALERVTMAFSHFNFSHNPEDVPVAIAERIATPDRIESIGSGIDLVAFDPGRHTAAERRATRAALGLGDEHRVLGMVGRLVEEKGYVELLRAAALLRPRFPDLRLLIVGDVEPEKKDAISAATAREIGVGDIALFVGHRDDVPDLYAAMDVFALPSHREGFPRAPMEAAASGLAAVVTDIRGCRQCVEHGRTGYLVPLFDHVALAASLGALLEDPARRAEFGAAALVKARREFDERVYFERIASRYRILLAERGRVGRASGTERA